MENWVIVCPSCGEKIKNREKRGRYCIKCGFDLSSLPGFFVSPILPNGFVLEKRYRIEKFISSGGMSHVYKVQDSRTGKSFALKEMKNYFKDEESKKRAIKRFKREAEILSHLFHPSIPRVIDYFIDNQRYYIVMDYIEGKTLEELLKASPYGKISQEKVLEWTWQIIDVLRYIHHLNPPIIYRDLKPSNILLSSKGKIYLIDFGISRVLMPQKKGTLIGTPGYAPPEQYQGIQDVRSDIYALGATLHHLLTGRDPQEEVPFQFPPIKSLIPDIEEGLEKAISGALEYNLEDRIKSIDDFASILASSDPSKANLMYNEGVKKFKEGEFQKAADLLSKSIAINPKNKYAYFMRGKVYVEMGETDRGVEDLNQAIRIDPNYTDAHFLLSTIFTSTGELEKAKEFIEKVISIDEGHYKALYQLGKIYMIEEDWDNAISTFQKAINYNSSFKKAYDKLKEAKLRKKTSKRIKLFDQSSADASNPAIAYYNLGMYFLEWGKLEEAEEEFKKAIKVAGATSTLLETLGNLYIRKKEYEKAALQFSKALSKAPEKKYLYLKIVKAYQKANKHKSAKEVLQIGIPEIINGSPLWHTNQNTKSLIKALMQAAKSMKIHIPNEKDIEKYI